MDANFSFILHEESFFFFFYTPIFTKYTHQFIYFTQLYNKIFIFLQIFIILSLTAPFSHRPITTNDPSTPSHHHHHATSIIKKNQPSQSETQSIPNPFNPNPIHHLPNLKSSQAKSSPTQPETHWRFDDLICVVWWSERPSFDDLIGVVQWSVAMEDRRGSMIDSNGWSAWFDDWQSAWLDDLSAASKRWSAAMEDDLIKWRKGEWGEMTETRDNERE